MEYTGLETYINQLIAGKKLSYLPFHKSLALLKKQQDGEWDELDKRLSFITALVEK